MSFSLMSFFAHVALVVIGKVLASIRHTHRSARSVEIPKRHRPKFLAQSVRPRHFPSETARKVFFKQLVEHNQDTSSMFTVQTVAHRTADTRSPVIMLTNREGYKYFFGLVPEGTQRVLNEHRIRLGKLKSIFFTGILSSWTQIGGLPGLFLTLSDATKTGIDIFAGSSSIYTYLVATWRSFVFRRGVQLKIHEATLDGIIGDSNLRVKCIKTKCEVQPDEQPHAPTYASQLKKLVSLMFPLDTSAANSADPQSYKSDPSETEIHTHVGLPNPEPILGIAHQDAVSYIVDFVPVRGKFDVSKAKALGLKPGAKFSKLARGESVLNDDGVEIRPDQVLEPEQTFPRMLIIDIPSAAYLENTIGSDVWFQGDEEIGLVYHLLGDDVEFDTPKYEDFMNKFPKAKHVISHARTAQNSLVFRRAAVDLLTLKTVHTSNFNLPQIPNVANTNGFSNGLWCPLQSLQQFHIGTTGVTYDDSAVHHDTWDSLYDEHVAPLEIPAANKVAVVNLAPLPLDVQADRNLKDQVNIVTLGTGLAIPSLQRNVISQLVRVPIMKDGAVEVRSVLLDGGENTLGTMLRNYSDSAQLNQILSELSMIHLSHLHADHHLGIISVINKWFEVNQHNAKKLYLIVPWQYDRFVKEWYNLERSLHPLVDMDRIVYFSCEEFLYDRRPEYQEQSIETFEERFDKGDLSRVVPRNKLAPRNDTGIGAMKRELGIVNIKTTRALHCAWAYSISIEFELSESETFKVSYSGDTRPNPKFVEIGHGSDLLIHESSLDNDLIEEALAKKHSTMIEAVSVSRYMDCSKLVLTHFSSRYSNKINISTDEERLRKLAAELNEYLVKYKSPSNIFLLENSKALRKEFLEMDVCFAFDMMNIKYSEVDFQKETVDIITRVFSPDDEIPEEDEKKLKKQSEKREAKRLQRLAMKENKKRKESP